MCSELRRWTQLFQALTPYRWLTLAAGLVVVLRSDRAALLRLWMDRIKKTSLWC